jgi:hypothetical protein
MGGPQAVEGGAGWGAHPGVRTKWVPDAQWGADSWARPGGDPRARGEVICLAGPAKGF